ncbi:MAG: DUF4105 domain-containing protein [Alphaproteobacteria bacterium]|nr:DUF4105 domain-containing protein [Alphaproteobacteria bacterium]
MRWARIAGWGLLALVFLISVAFGAGVLWYQGPGSAALRAILLIVWLAFSGACLIWFWRRRDGRVALAYVVPFGALALWLASIPPRNDRLWSFEMAQLLTYERQGDDIVLHNVRNFDWTGPMEARPSWERRRYDLTKLKGVDVLSLYFMGDTIAHTYFSFVWDGGEALSISVEIRKEKGEAYSPIGGFFKAYELAILAGDEHDFYGWRVYYPSEDIQLFHTRATPEEARTLLLKLLDAANALAVHPAYYNTLTDNCTSETWMLTEAMGADHPIDRRMLLSGYLPDMLYDMKLIDTSHPLSELREKGHILGRAKSALEQGLTGAAFSNALRDGIPPITEK